MQGADKDLVDAAATGELGKLDLPDKETRLLEFVYLLTVHSYKNSPQQVERLREVGWDDAEIRETVLVVGMFSMFNRVADAFGLDDPNYFEKEKRGEAIVPASKPS